MYHNIKGNSIKLEQIIFEKIDNSGPITFAEFMEMALYYPHYGYYARGHVPIGRSGDFVTSPHASPVFGGVIALQLYEMWNLLGKNEFYLCEIGAGSGLFMHDTLNYIRTNLPDFYSGLKVFIVEPIGSLEAVQRDLLKEFPCTWFNRLGEIGPINGCIVSNELIDAFPVHVIEMREYGFFEVYVSHKDRKHLTETYGSLSDERLQSYIHQYLGNVDLGYRTEINLILKDWLSEVAKVLKKGFLFTIDYGFSRKDYYSPLRRRGTLRAFHQHTLSDDLYSNPGERDITHHVNFTDMLEWGSELNFQPIGFCNQWSFLASLGIEKVIETLYPKGLDPFSPALAGIKMLLLPQGMGDSHKFFIQAKGINSNICLSGFKFQNKIDKLL